jgi:hypothetical protein
MTSYTNFDSEIYSEELATVTESEYDEVMQMLADEHEAQEGFATWSEETEQQAALEQDAFEQEQASQKDWLKNYSPNDVDGDSYAGIAI